jgi:hypothetical protein
MSQTRAASLRSGEAGSIAVTALLVLAILALLGLTLLDLSVREVQVSTNFSQATQSLYAAEAGIESAYQQIKILTTSSWNVNAAAPPAQGGTASYTPPAIPVSGGGSYNFSTFTVAALFVDCLGNPALLQCRQPIVTGPYQGLIAATQNYLITSEVTAPNQTSRARVVQAVQAGLIGLFQFAVFYDQDLEIFPGQPMTLIGRVHSNRDAYVGNGTRIDSYLTAANKIYNYRYDNNGPCGIGTCNGPGGGLTAWAQIKNTAGSYVQLNQDYRSTNPAWASWALSTYGGLVRDSALHATALNLPIDLAGGETPHQIIEKGVGGDSATLQDQKLYWQADYRILVDSSGGVTVKTGPFGSESDVTSNHDTSSFLTTNGNFYDGREQKCMQPAQINMGALRTASGWNFTKGILYVSSAQGNTGTCGTGTPSAARTPAVRVTNAAQLPSSAQGGFTVVSDRPVYIQGDYNTTNKVAAAVMGDAVTVLSNNWSPNNSDTKGFGAASGGNRTATATTINAALMSGNVPTISGSRYSGGLENYLRLLENWGGVTLTYNGSLIDLWQSQIATGAWGGNYYNVPSRNWGFDVLFNATLPPGTPRVQVTQRLGWWHQE